MGFGRRAPQTGRRRQGLRMYAGARLTRLTADWFSRWSSADAEIKTSLRLLRDRSRQLVRDNPYARQAKRTTQINVIGQGVKMQAQVMQLRGQRRDDRLNAMIEAGWERWCRKDSCDVAGRNSFFMMELLAAGALPESGEVLFRIVRRPFGRSRVPLALEILESDMLDENWQGSTLAAGNQWRMGVEIDTWGRPVRYAFYKKHPGDFGFVNARQDDGLRDFIDARDIIHLYLPERPAQTRGVPWFASVMDDLHQLEGYEQAAVVRARAASSLMGFITSPEGELQGDDVEGQQRVNEFEPGVFRYLNPGETVSVPQMSAPDAQYEMFVRSKARRFASGFGCSFETVSRDFSTTNYSSSRLSLLEDREHWRMIQAYLIENFHQRVYEEWLLAAVLSGELQLPDYELRPERYETPRWQPRGWSWVDPLKEVQAYREAEAAGYLTKSQIIAQLGGDMEDNFQQLAREQQLAGQLDLKLDADKQGTPTSPPAEDAPPQDAQA
jgi:hypothetical protein